MSSLKRVTRPQLNRALRTAVADFERCGLYTRPMREVPVRLTAGWAEGYGYFSERGEIEIPALSWSRVIDAGTPDECTLEDVLRHELAHALADKHLELVDTRQFRRVFGAGYWDEWIDEGVFDPDAYVTRYATTAPREDFAETVMVYTRHRGRVARYASRKGVMRAFRFVERLSHALQPHRMRPRLRVARTAR